ncbi:hypothetical protein KDA_47240 [Dictyobacter alpinus]|uniref:Uncharacterized protein n=1 Tax=Dictyobacter alpinus TaxID=2014873 RepID=A0A402BD43_9CHLR|nr:hypothetical protein KDA_47240 [Dictyobacter alpinus]
MRYPSIPDGERFLHALNSQFLCFAPISYILPQNSLNIHAIYQQRITIGVPTFCPPFSPLGVNSM